MIKRLVSALAERPRLIDAVVIGGYLLVSIAVFARLWLDVKHRMLLYTHADQQGFEWMIMATAKLITEGDNPLFTHLQNAPLGINIMAQTSILGLSLPLVPVTFLLGPEVTFAVLLTLGPAGTAGAWYWLFSRHLVETRLGAAIAGALCGFCPPLISHANGAHLNYIALFVLPFILWWTIRLREPGKWLRNGAILGLLVTYQLFVGEEPLLVAALGILVFLTAYAAFHPREVKESVRPFLSGLAVAATVTVVLSAYPLWWQFFGPQSYGDIPHASKVGNDVAALTTFASQSLGGGHPVGKLAMNPSEENGFLGLPLLVLAATVAIWLWRHSALARASTITAAFLLACSLGVEIIVDGRHTGVPGPWRLFSSLPLVGSILPGRLTLAAVPAIAALLAIATARVLAMSAKAAESQLPLRLLWFGALSAVLLPIAPTPVEYQPRTEVPTFFTAGAWRDYVRPGGTLLAVPPPNGSYPAPLRWQLAADLQFRNVDGYFIGPHGPDRHGWYGAEKRPTTELLHTAWLEGEVPAITAEDRRRVQEDLRYWQVEAVVLGPGHKYENALLTTATTLFGPGQQVGGVWVWDVRGRA